MSEQVVVVGVDGSPASYTALRWALEYAGRTGAWVQAVRCRLPVVARRWEAAVTAEPVPPHTEQQARAERELAQVVAAALARDRGGARMTAALVRPVPAPSSRLTVPTVPSRRRVATRNRTTAQQPADTARRVADTYPELLTPDEFDPTRFPRDEDHEGVVRQLPVQSQRRVLLRLLAALDRPVAVVVHTAAPLVTLLGRVVGLVTLAEQTLTAMHAAVTRTDALLDRVEAVTCTAEGVAQAASRAVTAATGVTEETRVLTARAAPLLEGYSEPLRRLEPVVRRLAETTQRSEVDALVTLLDRLPQLADAMDHDVIPLLGHLDQVCPGINQLLDRVSQLSHMPAGCPRCSGGATTRPLRRGFSWPPLTCRHQPLPARPPGRTGVPGLPAAA